MRIFLDANILFSAAKSDGAVRELLRRLCNAGHALCADAYVVAEARRNLESKSEKSVAALDSLLRQVEVASFRAHELPKQIAALLPEKDRPVLAAAIGMACGALVTGDRTHFGKLYETTVASVIIHSPHSLAEAILKN